MKRLIVCTALIAISLKGDLFAQDNNTVTFSKTESNFNMHPSQVNNRHWVYLPKDEKMIIELHNTDDYNMLANIEQVLSKLMTDIAFYKDSLSATGNVRIDYVYATYQHMDKIRFKKYAPDGDLFIAHRTDRAKLKIEQDTIRLLLERAPEEEVNYMKNGLKIAHRDNPVQVTFCLNNYEDLSIMLGNKGMLNHIIDTLTTASNPKHRKGFPFYNTSSIAYRPFDTGTHSSESRFRKINYLWEDEKDMGKAHGTLQISGSLGLGVIRSMLTPMAEIHIEINDRSNMTPNKYSFLRASATPYFFFDKDLKNNIRVYDNWFATLEFGTQLKEKSHSVGIGYLFAEKGSYFQNTTMKAFVTYTISKRITLCPEIIFTNDFKQVFPGVTVKF